MCFGKEMNGFSPREKPIATKKNLPIAKGLPAPFPLKNRDWSTLGEIGFWWERFEILAIANSPKTNCANPNNFCNWCSTTFPKPFSGKIAILFIWDATAALPRMPDSIPQQKSSGKPTEISLGLLKKLTSIENAIAG